MITPHKKKPKKLQYSRDNNLMLNDKSGKKINFIKKILRKKIILNSR
jgi:hypothetical protein